MIKGISEYESRAITYVRAGAMLAIVIHHFLSCYNNLAMHVFNIGVQVFLALSGYLYGKKIISNWHVWSTGRLKRVYLPMALFLIIVLPLYLVFRPDVFSWNAYWLNLLNLQGFPFVLSSSGEGTLVGVRHLWFITAIMFGYIFTPLLQRFVRYSKLVLPVLLVIVGLSYFFLPGKWVFIASWLFLYAISYLYVNVSEPRLYNIGLVVLECIVLFFVVTHVRDITSFYSPLYRILHDVTGLFIVIIGIHFLTRLKIKQVPKLVSILDDYSYYIFIVHYFIIIGPFSLAHVTPFKYLNILIMLSAIIFGSFLFKRLSDSIIRVLFKEN